jgi:hypothetical protein
VLPPGQRLARARAEAGVPGHRIGVALRHDHPALVLEDRLLDVQEGGGAVIAIHPGLQVDHAARQAAQVDDLVVGLQAAEHHGVVIRTAVEAVGAAAQLGRFVAQAARVAVDAEAQRVVPAARVDPAALGAVDRDRLVGGVVGRRAKALVTVGAVERAGPGVAVGATDLASP